MERRFAAIVILMAVGLVVAACGGDAPKAPPTPTPIDTGAIVQEAVQEALSQAEKQLDEATAAAAKAREADAAAAQAAVAKALTAAEKAAAEAQKAAVAEALAAAEKQLADATAAAEKARDAAAAAAAATAAATAAAAAAAAAAPVPFDAAYFKGKTLRMIVPYDPGGGYDANSRMVAKHLGDYLPGNPKIIVQNRSGAGGLIGSNFMYNSLKAPNIGMFPTDVVANQIVGSEGVEFDFTKFNYVGSLSRATKACFARVDANVNTVQDVIGRSEPLYVASSGSGDKSWSQLLLQELGANIHQVTGYQGTADMHIALEAGEVDARCTTWSTVPASNPAWFEDPKLVKPFIQFTTAAPDPDKHLAGVEQIIKYKDQFSDIGWNTMLASAAPLQTYRAIVLPPGAPAGMVTVFREAFWEMVTDDPFKNDLKRIGRPLDPQKGADVERQLVTELSVSPEVVIAFKKLLGVE